MEIQHERSGLRTPRIEARPYRPVHNRNRHVLYAGYRDRFARDGWCPQVAERLTDVGNRQRPLRLLRVRELGFNKLLQCAVECHCVSLRAVFAG